MRFYTFSMAALLALTISACGTNSGNGPDLSYAGSLAASTGKYNITMTDLVGPHKGRSLVRLHVTSVDDAAAEPAGITGLDLSVSVAMQMSGGTNHSTPIGGIAEEGNGDYLVSIYYLMSTMMNGMKMGDWEIGVTVDAETATFNPAVDMTMDTPFVKLQNESDAVGDGSGSEENRPWYLFNESCVGSGDNHTLTIFLTAQESLQSFPSVPTGRNLTSANGNSWLVESLSIKASTDKTNWLTMTELGGGYYRVSGLTGLTDGVSGEIYISMSVNGNDYTTDGASVSGENGYQTFTVTPGSEM